MDREANVDVQKPPCRRFSSQETLKVIDLLLSLPYIVIFTHERQATDLIITFPTCLQKAITLFPPRNLSKPQTFILLDTLTQHLPQDLILTHLLPILTR